MTSTKYKTNITKRFISQKLNRSKVSQHLTVPLYGEDSSPQVPTCYLCEQVQFGPLTLCLQIMGPIVPARFILNIWWGMASRFLHAFCYLNAHRPFCGTLKYLPLDNLFLEPILICNALTTLTLYFLWSELTRYLINTILLHFYQFVCEYD